MLRNFWKCVIQKAFTITCGKPLFYENIIWTYRAHSDKPVTKSSSQQWDSHITSLKLKGFILIFIPGSGGTIEILKWAGVFYLAAYLIFEVLNQLFLNRHWCWQSCGLSKAPCCHLAQYPEHRTINFTLPFTLFPFFSSLCIPGSSCQDVHVSSVS